MLDEEELVAALRRHWDHSAKDEDVAHEIYHDDAAQPWMFTVSIMQLRDDGCPRRIYITDGWEAADFRAPWRSERRADPLPPDP
jgi:hypothetical protein